LDLDPKLFDAILSRLSGKQKHLLAARRVNTAVGSLMLSKPGLQFEACGGETANNLSWDCRS
jgi:hypothetical protein